jgi:glycosyltransferase involved in cell wall biosynthesis
MACGCPVITCPISSIPEVAGSVPIYINPNDVQGLCAALQEVQKPEIRQFMTRQGLERSKQFSWAKMAKSIAEILVETAIKSGINKPYNMYTNKKNS